MKKIFGIVCAALVAGMLMGCASNADKVAKKNDLPTWAVSESKLDWSKGIYASGSAKYSDRSTALKAARLQARGALATRLGEIVENYEHSDTDTATGADPRYKQELDAVATQVVSGARQEELYIDDDGTFWVLMFMPHEDVIKNFKSSAVAAGNKRLEKVFSNITAADIEASAKATMK